MNPSHVSDPRHTLQRFTEISDQATEHESFNDQLAPESRAEQQQGPSL